MPAAFSFFARAKRIKKSFGAEPETWKDPFVSRPPDGFGDAKVSHGRWTPRPARKVSDPADGIQDLGRASVNFLIDLKLLPGEFIRAAGVR